MSAVTTVASLQLADVVAALGALGIDTDAVCRTVALDPSVLYDSAARVPASVLAGVFEEAERRTGDPLVGLHAAARIEPRGPLAYLMLAHPRLEDGLRRVERFSSLPVDSLRIAVERDGDVASMVIDAGAELDRNPHTTDYVLMFCVSLLRRVVGPAMTIHAVHARHDGWTDRAEVERVFGCSVRAGQPDSRVLFPANALRAPSVGGNPVVAAQMDRMAAALREARAPWSFREQAAAATRAIFREGRRADRASVSRRLRLGRRTLLRRLAAEGATFKAVRDGVLREVVEELLANPSLNVERVALSVGFANVAAFSRAFKRWTGESPTAYRESRARPA